MDLQMSVHFAIRWTCTKATHDCNKVFGINLPLSLLVIKGETFFELYMGMRKPFINCVLKTYTIVNTELEVV